MGWKVLPHSTSKKLLCVIIGLIWKVQREFINYHCKGKQPTVIPAALVQATKQRKLEQE